MAERENSAFRLYRFVQKMVPQPQNIPTAQVLLNAFGAERLDEARAQNAMIAHVVSLLFSELDLLIEESRRCEFSDKSREPIVTAFDRLSVAGMAAQWQHNCLPFQSCLPALLIFGEGLPHEGALVPNDDLTDLQNAITSLREEVQKLDLPNVVKIFVYEQINIIARAIADYPIVGVKAFRAATRETTFHEVEHIEVIKEFGKTSVMTRLKAITAKVREMSKFAGEVNILLTVGESLYEHGAKALDAAAPIAHQVVNTIQHIK